MHSARSRSGMKKKIRQNTEIDKYLTYSTIWLESIDSTNNEAKRRLDCLSTLSVIAAYNQTAGRGQRGNIWLSSSGKNLTFSIVLKFDDIQSQNFNQSDINDIISLTIVELLSNYGINARIKYPNDIYVGDKKICGILIEHSLRGNKMVNSIIGVGLNVNQQQFDISLPNPTSMISETRSKEIDLPTLLEELLEIFIKYASHLFDSVSNT